MEHSLIDDATFLLFCSFPFCDDKGTLYIFFKFNYNYFLRNAIESLFFSKRTWNFLLIIKSFLFDFTLYFIFLFIPSRNWLPNRHRYVNVEWWCRIFRIAQTADDATSIRQKRPIDIVWRLWCCPMDVVYCLGCYLIFMLPSTTNNVIIFLC